ncbi:hypothetical protein DSOL_2619 [Desulfosporosinus metallidurans]|uniref:Uncharacterized protein n=1 Tax=Desulfosporosinus metallidurans TaxID=1888891 RepID=A0A1Q8QVX4_9FIRM|nr:hypothetical protein DSOL_2619 [Desulfosporosinus metallidurans]
MSSYNILLTKEPYKELGTEYLAEREREKEQRVIRQLQLKGYQVSNKGYSNPKVVLGHPYVSLILNL